MRKARAILPVVVAGSICCGELARQGTASSYLIVDSVEATSGVGGNDFGGHLESDVATIVNGSKTVVQDLGRATFSLALKDPGPVASPTTPSTANWITLSRYRVRFIRADGRNTPGLDVPYAFDGALTLTVSGQASMTFALVRAQAKSEAPLAALANNSVIISTLAEITFYGRDQAGREVSTVAWISVHFGDWLDPK